MVLVEPQVVAIQAEINIQTSVAVVVGDRRMGKRPLRRALELERVLLDRKRSIALIEKKQRTTTANDQKVLPSFVFEVCEQGARRVVQHADAGLLRHVFQRPIAPVAVEPVWQARRLADIQVIESVIVVVTRGDPIVAVNIDAAGTIQNGAPIVGATKHLRRIRLRLSQGVPRDIHESRLIGNRYCFYLRLPPSCCPPFCIVA